MSLAPEATIYILIKARKVLTGTSITSKWKFRIVKTAIYSIQANTICIY